MPSQQLSEVSAGRHSACGVNLGYDEVRCWGYPDAVRLVKRAIGVTSIFVGDRHACGLTTSSTIRCWGDSDVIPDVPEQIRFHSVAFGPTITCGLRRTLTVDCWGSAAVEDVPPDSLWAVTVGRTFACGLRPDKSVVCWGDVASAIWEPSGTPGNVRVRD